MRRRLSEAKCPECQRKKELQMRTGATGSPGRAVRAGLAAALLLLLQACAARPPAQIESGSDQPASPQPAETPALGGRLQADAHEYPWSALGRVNLAGQGFCTGILIGPQQVLTQARCLYAGREDRWWQPQELHFIAAYQKDSFLADSPVASFTVAPGFNPLGGTSLANLTNNWAVVTLRQPIGQKTGWLGLEWDSPRLKAAAQRGAAAYLRAGYRSDWPHAISLHFGCSEAADSAVRLCDPTPTELALPSFVLAEGELRVLADFYLRSAAQSGTLANLTAMPIANNRLGRATAPAAASPVRRQPTVSAALFLAGLGYDVAGNGLAAAVADYLGDQGLPAGSGADIALLTALVASAQRDQTNR
jgi:V8-like Glu-specific endopeptidase